MKINKRYFIFGYWHSSNIGDSIAPWLVLKSLPENRVSFCVNLIEPNANDTVGSVTISPDGEILNVLKPSDVLSIITEEDVLVLTVGSLTPDQLAFGTIRLLCSLSSAPSLIVWGGIQDYTALLNNPGMYESEIKIWKELFSYKNVLFFARSEMEILAIRELILDQEAKVNIRLGGDPVGLVAHVLHDFINYTKKFSSNSFNDLFITSIHLFERNCSSESNVFYFSNFYKIGMDKSTDSLLNVKMIDESISNIYRLIEVILNSRSVVSARLHGAVIASILGLDIVAIGLNEKFLNISNFNGKSTLFDVTNDLYDFKPIKPNINDVNDFVNLSSSTIKYINNI